VGIAGLVPAVLAEASTRPSVRAPELASIVWATGKIVPHADRQCLLALLQASNVTNCKPMEIASLVWGLAKCRVYYMPAFTYAAEVLEANTNLSAPFVAQLTWALSEAGLIKTQRVHRTRELDEMIFRQNSDEMELE
jgi:hypothetical protein